MSGWHGDDERKHVVNERVKRLASQQHTKYTAFNSNVVQRL